MTAEHIRNAAAELERQLNGTVSLDEESRQVLERALADIRSALDERPPSEEEPQSVSGRLRVAVEKFEGTHPTLTGTFMRLIDGLAEMGI